MQPDKLVEQRPCEQHRVTLAASIRSERNLAVAPPPFVGHAIYRFGIYAGLIAEENHNRVGSRVESPDARAVRRGASGAEDRVFNHLRASEDDLLTYLISRAAQNDDHFVKPRRSPGLIDDPAEQSTPSEGKKLFGLPEAARSSRAENQPGDKFPIHKQSAPYFIRHMKHFIWRMK